MLKYRVITALILAPLVLLAVYYLPSEGFALFVGAVVFLSALEWGTLMGLKHTYNKITYACIVSLCLCFLYFNVSFFVLLIMGLLLWIALIAWVFIYPKGKAFWDYSVLMKSFLGLCLFSSFWAATNLIHDYSPNFIFLLLAIVWATDSGAYFVGKKWGKHKLAPAVSPNKSREGFWGGIVTALLVSAFFVPFLKLDITQSFVFMGIILMTSIMSVFGDLAESMFKRLQNVKDSGNLLPGHGGLLDRIDSLLSASVTLALGLFLLYA